MRIFNFLLAICFLSLFAACGGGGGAAGGGASKDFYISLNWADGEKEMYESNKPNWSAGSVNGGRKATTNGFRDESSNNVMPVVWIDIFELGEKLSTDAAALAGKTVDCKVKLMPGGDDKTGTCTINKVEKIDTEDPSGSGDKVLYKVSGSIGEMTVAGAKGDKQLKGGEFAIRAYGK